MIIVNYNIRGLGKREKRRDVRELIRKVRTDICCLQESKLEVVTKRTVKALLGKANCEWDFAESEGSSGGIITLWNPSVFCKISSWSTKEMLIINGYLVEDGKNCTVVNVYAPNTPSLRWDLWDQISIIAEKRGLPLHYG